MTEVRLRENVVSYKEAKQQRKEKLRKACKAFLRDKEQKITVREQRRVSLAETIKNVVAKFPP